MELKSGTLEGDFMAKNHYLGGWRCPLEGRGSKVVIAGGVLRYESQYAGEGCGPRHLAPQRISELFKKSSEASIPSIVMA